MQEFEDSISQAVGAALKRLLSEKHLYQSVDLELTPLRNIASTLHRTAAQRTAMPDARPGARAPSVKELLEAGMKIAARFWIPDNPKLAGAMPLGLGRPEGVVFKLPTINTFCDECSARLPFNPVFDAQMSIHGTSEQQWFHLGYQCQQCKGLPVRFLVRRGA